MGFKRIGVLAVHCLLYTTVKSVPSLDAEITSVESVPGFQDVLLSWTMDYTNKFPARWTSVLGKQVVWFRVRYCEIQVWGEHHCKAKIIRRKKNNKIFQQKITELKMNTDYNFYLSYFNSKEEIEEYLKTLPSKRMRFGRKEKQLKVSTKGFSATASDCSPDKTIVEVKTGPNFDGRIGAEGSLHPSCNFQGSGGDKDVYTLTIDHKLCGTTMNGTTAWTYIVVQENLPILTHTTKRFQVICKLLVQDTYTVKTGFILPGSSNVRLPSTDRSIERSARNLIQGDIPRHEYNMNLDIENDMDAQESVVDIITLEDYIDSGKEDELHNFIRSDFGTQGSHDKDVIRQLEFHAAEKQLTPVETGYTFWSSLPTVDHVGYSKKEILNTVNRKPGLTISSKELGLETEKDSLIASVLVLCGIGVCVLLCTISLICLCRPKKEEKVVKRKRRKIESQV